MEFSNNEVILTRREQQALEIEQRYVAAAAIGAAWRNAYDEQTAVVAEANIKLNNPFHYGRGVHPMYAVRRIAERRLRTLKKMHHAVAAIGMETVPDAPLEPSGDAL